MVLICKQTLNSKQNNITNSTDITMHDLTCHNVSASNNVSAVSVTLNGSDLQTTLNGKQPNIISSTDLTMHDLTCHNVSASNNITCTNMTASSNVSAVSVTLNGSDLQTTLNGKQPNIINSTDLTMHDLTCHNITCTSETVNGLNVYGELVALDSLTASQGTAIGVIQGEVSVLQGQMTIAIADIATLNGEMSDAQADLATLQAKTQHQTCTLSATNFSKSINLDDNFGAQTIHLDSNDGNVNANGDVTAGGSVDCNYCNVNSNCAVTEVLTVGYIGNTNTHNITGGTINLTALSITLNGILTGSGMFWSQCPWLS